MDGGLFSLLSICGVLALGAMTPGQSFILVARTAVVSSLRDGLATACGMGVGVAVFALVALLGLQSLLLAVPWLYGALKIAGGLYLIYLALQMIRASRSPLTFDAAQTSAASAGKSFRAGLLTQLSNPNTALVFGGVFAALLSRHVAGWMYAVLPALAFLIDFLWYALVAMLLSAQAPRNAYLRFRSLFDRLGGAVMGLLGIKLLLQR